MEVMRGEEEEIIPPTSSTQIFTPSQTLDHNHHQYLHPQLTNPSSDLAATTARSSSPSPPPPPRPPSTTVKYKECLKNHAASMGGQVLDGCGEFMPSGEENTPEALKCAACDCHRSFHRKMNGEESESDHHHNNNRRKYQNYHHHHHHHHQRLLHNQLAPPPPAIFYHNNKNNNHSHYNHRSSSGKAPVVAPLMMAFGGGAAESSSEDLNNIRNSSAAVGQKKRFRTKFSQEQKEKMMEMAEKIGWRIHKEVEDEVLEFCDHVGVKRQVFKVWMHNNKQLVKKKDM